VRAFVRELAREGLVAVIEGVEGGGADEGVKG
jgi:hypothetical protein